LTKSKASVRLLAREGKCSNAISARRSSPQGRQLGDICQPLILKEKGWGERRGFSSKLNIPSSSAKPVGMPLRTQSED